MAAPNPNGGYYGAGAGAGGWAPAGYIPPQTPTRMQPVYSTPQRYAQPAPPPPPPGPEMAGVLLSLADTYITTAHANGHKAATGSDAEVKAYCKLVATGLQCLEAALQVGSLRCWR
jgi:hypothetical protein